MNARQLSCALFLIGACTSPREVVVRKNECVADSECEPKARCSAERGMCERTSVEMPYSVVLQVHSSSPSDVRLVQDVTFESFLFNGPLQRDLVVPRAQAVRGRVMSEGALLAAQVTFYPAASAVAPVSPVVVNTRSVSASEDNLFVELMPGAEYRMRIQPLGEPSQRLPPLDLVVTPAQRIDVTYPALERLRIRLVQRNQQPLDGQRVRLEDSVTGEVLSSSTVVRNGQIELFAAPEVRSRRPHRLVVSLEESAPWRVVMHIEQALLHDQATITLPNIPNGVTYNGRVAIHGEEGAQEPAAFANLTFISRFLPPAQTSDVNGRDWCKPRDGEEGRISCRAEILATTNMRGEYVTSLLPGDYDIYVVPSDTSDVRQLLSIGQETESILERTTGSLSGSRTTQGGRIFVLPRSGVYRGSVQSGTADPKPMPNVVIVARSLGIAGEIGEVARFNRSASAITRERGEFDLLFDPGYFDLYIEPPKDSGFAWTGYLNQRLEGELNLAPLSAPSPVYLEGRVTRPSSTPSETEPVGLAGARVEAFAIVEQQSRTVRVAQTVTDEDGLFRLPMPPAVVTGSERPER